MVDLTLGNIFKFWVKDEGVGPTYKSGICDTKPAIPMKRSSLEPNLGLLQNIYRNFRVRPIDGCKIIWCTSVNLGLFFPGNKYFSKRISCTLFVGAQRNLAASWVWLIETYFPNFVNFGPDVPRYRAATYISC